VKPYFKGNILVSRTEMAGPAGTCELHLTKCKLPRAEASLNLAGSGSAALPKQRAGQI
jgi:hypothetical protein